MNSGQPGTKGFQTRPVEVRFWEKVDRSGGPDSCWPWLGARNWGGYGRFDNSTAHRVAYLLVRGVIPRGLDLDHRCHSPESCAGGTTCLHRRCVNPAHLEPASRSENLRRGVMRRSTEPTIAETQREKTRCPRGHSYTPENTYVLPARPTARYCRACHTIDTRLRRGWSRDRAFAGIAAD